MEAAPCILALENNASDYLLLSLAARRAGISVNLQQVSKPEEALAYLQGQGTFGDRKQHPFPSLVITNLKLHGSFAGGHEFIRQIRLQFALQTLPIAVLSGTIDERDAEATYNAGANIFLNKTASLEELTIMVRGLVNYFCTS
jgi:CheY-like chemotaxis protein